ncbi:MAG TPA: hypothetical protein VHM25_19815 [Polyangiaceae bacterium]|jgi:hypothetical protein|nr:hypothetical protein [Polyangiaceae bacterium]
MTPTDEKQLRLLSHLHYAAAALASVIPFFGAGYGTMRLSIALDRMPNLTPTVRDVFAWIPPALGLLVILLGFATLGANLLAAQALRNRTHCALGLLTAVANCLQVPLGTLLGVFSFIVPRRPAVRAAFSHSASATTPESGPAWYSPRH